MDDHKVTSISSLEEGFNELQHYSDSQFKVIKELQGKISQLQAENSSLKTMIEQNLPSLSLDADFILGVSNEQLICETQLLLLKNKAVIAELTLEESRKFQIFTDILQKIKTKDPNAVENTVKKMTPAELIAIASPSE
jgi:hypothetical protein